jgi:hypothetical protein
MVSIQSRPEPELLRDGIKVPAHIPLVMEGGKELRNRCREQIVTLADGRKET